MAECNPLVSVAIPIYNGAEFLLKTLQSIDEQTYKNLEIILVDDGSSDNSFELCKLWATDSQLRVIIQKNDRNLGITKTCNIILDLSKGKYFQLFGQDDTMLPDKIEDDVLLFEKQEEDVALIYANLNLINEKGEVFGKGYFDRIGFKGHKNDDLFLELIKSNFIPAPSVMVRSEILKKSGGYDENLQFDDWDMWLRLAKDYKFIYNDKVNVNYRIHNSSMMANRNSASTILRNKANIMMFKKHLGSNNIHDKALYKKLDELSLYSYFLGDADAAEIMGDYLKNKFDLKLWIYRKLALAGIKHPSKWMKEINKLIKQN